MAVYNNRVLMGYAVSVLIIIAVINTPVAVPCLFKLIFNIPCPGCGLFRAGVYISRLEFANAFRMNILVLPLMLGGFAHFVCAVSDASSRYKTKNLLGRFNALLMKNWVIAAAVILMLSSWYYNIVRGI